MSPSPGGSRTRASDSKSFPSSSRRGTNGARSTRSTLVLDVNATGFPRDYSTSPYEGYFASDRTMFPVWLRSDALETKERVYALIIQGMPKAYPVDLLKEERITHDAIRSTAIVLLTNPRSGAVRAYESEGKRFGLTDAPDVIVDEATGERWSVREDSLLSPSGETLPTDTQATMRSGSDGTRFFPTTEIYTDDSRQRPSSSPSRSLCQFRTTCISRRGRTSAGSTTRKRSPADVTS